MWPSIWSESISVKYYLDCPPFALIVVLIPHTSESQVLQYNHISSTLFDNSESI